MVRSLAVAVRWGGLRLGYPRFGYRTLKCRLQRGAQMTDPIKSQAQSIVNQYDENQDGKVKLPPKPKPCDGGVENVCLFETHETYRRVGEYGVASRQQLFVEADANGDGFATVDEVADVMRTFDQSGDGKLDAKEKKAFNRKYREEIEE